MDKPSNDGRDYDSARSDSRIGYEASNHYYDVPFDFVEKVLNCEHVLETLSKGSGEAQN